MAVLSGRGNEYNSVSKGCCVPQSTSSVNLEYRARICKPLKELRNPFSAWRAGTTSLFGVPARQGIQPGGIDFLGIDSWAPWTFKNLGSEETGTIHRPVRRSGFLRFITMSQLFQALPLNRISRIWGRMADARLPPPFSYFSVWLFATILKCDRYGKVEWP